MSRIQACFEQLQSAGRKALIPYVTAGDPYADITVDLMLGMARAGADVIELGVPFSDPMADGPVIQKASERALAKGVTLVRVLEMVKAFRTQNDSTPVVLMGYANPVERYDQRHGPGRFAQDAAEAGVDGVLIVDYPPEEAQDFTRELQRYGLDPIFLLAPTSTESRIREHVKVPLGVGFGIRDAQTARAIADVSDAVVIGSRLIQLIESQPHEKVVGTAVTFIRDIRRALDA